MLLCMRSDEYELDVNQRGHLKRWLSDNPDPVLTPGAARALAMWRVVNKDASGDKVAMAAWRFQREDLERQLAEHQRVRPSLVVWAHRTMGHYVKDVATRMGISRSTATPDVDQYLDGEKLARFTALFPRLTQGADYLVALGKWNTYEVTLGYEVVDDSPQPSAGSMNAASALVNRLTERKLRFGPTDDTNEDLLVYLARGGSLTVYAFGPPVPNPSRPQWVDFVAEIRDEL